MSPDLAHRLVRLGRWPTRLRRIAALACLLLAAVTALHPSARAGDGPSRRSQSTSANPLTSRLGPGQVAAPVRLAESAPGGFLRVGDRVDLYAGDGGSGVSSCPRPGAVASAVRVLAAPASRPGLTDRDSGAAVVVALSPATVARLAQTQGCTMFAVLRR